MATVSDQVGHLLPDALATDCQSLPAHPHHPLHASPFEGVEGVSSFLVCAQELAGHQSPSRGWCPAQPLGDRMELMLAVAAVATLTAGLAIRQADKRQESWDAHVDQALELVR